MSAWQPIDSAPKDGTRVLLYTIEGLGESIEYPAMGTGRYERFEDGSEGWIATTLPDQSFYGSMSRPAFWMPLPSPPRSAR